MAMCGKCKRPVSAAEAGRVVEHRVHPDGTDHMYGYNQPEPLKLAKGKLKGVFHYKCWAVWRKQFRPTTDERGRYRAESPDVYAMSMRAKNRDDVSGEARARRERAEREYSVLLEKRSEAVKSAELVEDLDKHLRVLEEEIALAARQEEIEAQRGMEQTPRGDDDWRDPIQVEI